MLPRGGVEVVIGGEIVLGSRLVVEHRRRLRRPGGGRGNRDLVGVVVSGSRIVGGRADRNDGDHVEAVRVVGALPGRRFRLDGEVDDGRRGRGRRCRSISGIVRLRPHLEVLEVRLPFVVLSGEELRGVVAVVVLIDRFDRFDRFDRRHFLAGRRRSVSGGWRFRVLCFDDGFDGRDRGLVLRGVFDVVEGEPGRTGCSGFGSRGRGRLRYVGNSGRLGNNGCLGDSDDRVRCFGGFRRRLDRRRLRVGLVAAARERHPVGDLGCGVVVFVGQCRVGVLAAVRIIVEPTVEPGIGLRRLGRRIIERSRGVDLARHVLVVVVHVA